MMASYLGSTILTTPATAAAGVEAFDSAWWCPVLALLVFALASTPLFKAADSPPNGRKSRNPSIDGLRGFLAIAIVLYHLDIYHGYLLGGTAPQAWVTPVSHFYAGLGPAAVAMFFMITGYLFWWQVLEGRFKSKWIAFFLGRIFRIGPLYVLVIMLTLCVDHSSLFATQPASLHKEAEWLGLLGLAVYPDNNKILAGVTWTIQCEWLFYLSLPLLARIARIRKLSLPATLGCAVLFFVYQHYFQSTQPRPGAFLLAVFALAMAGATIRHKYPEEGLPDRISSTLVLLMLALALSWPSIFSATPIVLIATSFYLMASGSTVFGLLASRAAIRLGNISYGVYLCQGIVLAVFFRPTIYRRLLLASPIPYWGMASVAMCLLALLAMLAHVAIEKPGIILGQRMKSRYLTSALNYSEAQASPAYRATLNATADSRKIS